MGPWLNFVKKQLAMRTIILTSVLFVSQFISAQTTWYPIFSGTGAHLRAIDFPSENVGYIVGDSAVMLKTIDGGVTWNPVNYTGIGPLSSFESFSDIDFVDELNGFVVVANNASGSYVTSDGGLTWTADVTTSNMCYKWCVYPMSTDDWFVGGAGCFQSAMVDHRTTSGWDFGTINYESFNPGEYVAQLDFSGNVGVAAMNGPYILRSIDNGTIWDTVSTGISSQGVHTAIHFLTPTTVYAGYRDGGGGFGVLVSYDAGLTWEQDINSATFFYPSYLSLTSANNGELYVGAQPSGWPNEGLIFEYDGVNWSYVQVEQAINSMASYGNDVTFGVGDSGLVVVNVDLSVLGVGVNLPDMEMQVFPNPTKDFVSLPLDPSSTESFAVFNLKGEEQAVAVERTTSAAIFNLTDLPNGIYLLKVNSENALQTHRIVKMD